MATPLELHIFGPAFNLPSIDPECLAAILYFSQALPEGQWSLIASNDLNSNPFRQLPALRHGELWIAGYRQMVEYLKEIDVSFDLDSGLNAAQRADSVAYTSFIRSKGLPLLDLSFYVSSDNYTTVIRGAWAELLSWPVSWTLPHTLRDHARKRSAHLGLSALDVDTAREREELEQERGLTGQIPKSLRKSKITVSGLLGKTAQNTKFRLDAATDAFLGVLSEKLNTPAEGGLLGAGFHTVDCLAVAYLSLMSTPDMPQSWLKDAMNGRYRELGEWVRNHTTRGFGLVDTHASECALPWKSAAPRTLTQTAQVLMETVIRSIPVLYQGLDGKEVHPPPTPATRAKSRQSGRQLAYTSLRNKQVLYSQAATAILTTTSVIAWLMYAGILSMPYRRHTLPSSRQRFGEAGSLLGLR